jgi:hypothetical protein
MSIDLKRYLTPADHPLNRDEARIYGANARRHPVTGMPLEQGSGCLPDDHQAVLVHLPEIARHFGPEVAAEVRRKLELASRPLAKKD